MFSCYVNEMFLPSSYKKSEKFLQNNMLDQATLIPWILIPLFVSELIFLKMVSLCLSQPCFHSTPCLAAHELLVLSCFPASVFVLLCVALFQSCLPPLFIHLPICPSRIGLPLCSYLRLSFSCSHFPPGWLGVNCSIFPCTPCLVSCLSYRTRFQLTAHGFQPSFLNVINVDFNYILKSYTAPEIVSIYMCKNPK